MSSSSAARPAKRRRKTGNAQPAAQGIVDVQVLGTGANGLAAAVVLRTNRGHYLFNVGDGLQRFCVEHKVRMGRIKGVFLTSLRVEATGGLPGALLTMADLSTSVGPNTVSAEHRGGSVQGRSIDIFGPTGTGYFVYGMRHFYHRPQFGLQVTERAATACSKAGTHGGMERVQTVVLKASHRDDTSSPGNTQLGEAADVMAMELPADKKRVVNDRFNLAVNFTARKSEEQESVSSCSFSAPSPYFDPFKTQHAPRTPFLKQLPLPSDDVCCYICQTPSIRGKFDAAKAATLGISGRDRGRLVRGQGPITLENGTIVMREDIVADDMPGATFAVIDCPSEAYVASLTSQEQLFHKHRNPAAAEMAPTSSDPGNSSTGITTAIGVVFHFAAPHVLVSPSYVRFLAGFPPTTLHVIQNASHSPAIDAMMAGRRNIILLNQLHSNIFPSPRLEADEAAGAPSATASSYHCNLPDLLGLQYEKCVLAQTKARIRLVPVSPTITMNTDEVPIAEDRVKIIAEAYDSQFLSLECIAHLREKEARIMPGTCSSSLVGAGIFCFDSTTAHLRPVIYPLAFTFFFQ